METIISLLFLCLIIAGIVYAAAKKTVSKRFYLSTIVIVLGVLMFISDSLKPITNPMAVAPNPLLGIQIVMGTLVYRSIKRSRLGRNVRSELRIAIECIVLILATLPTVWTTFVIQPSYPSWKFVVMYHPARVIMPIWFYVAYLIMWKKKPVSQVTPGIESPEE